MQLLFNFFNISSKLAICSLLSLSLLGMFLSGGAINTITRQIDGSLGILEVKRTADELFLAKTAISVVNGGEIEVKAFFFQIIADAIKSVVGPVIKIIGEIISQLVSAILQPIMDLIDSIMSVVTQFVDMINSLSSIVGSSRIGVGIKIFSELEDKDVGDLNSLIATINGGYVGKANLIEDSIAWLDLKYIQEKLQQGQIVSSITTEVKQTLNKLDNSEDLLSTYGAKLGCSGVADFLPEFVQGFARANSLCEETAKTNIQIALQARKDKIEQASAQIIAELENSNKGCASNYYIKSDNQNLPSGNFRQKLNLIGKGVEIKTLTAEECELAKNFKEEKTKTKKDVFIAITNSIASGSLSGSINTFFEPIFKDLAAQLTSKFGELANITNNLQQGALSFNLNTILGYDLNFELQKEIDNLNISKLEQDFT
jgi:tetrahydromethanopterin S-methyltransferase subunit B